MEPNTGKSFVRGNARLNELLARPDIAAGVAAVALGPVPFSVDEHWREVAEFAATSPVTFRTGEDGEPIARGHISTGYGYIEDYGTDDELNLD